MHTDYRYRPLACNALPVESMTALFFTRKNISIEQNSKWIIHFVRGVYSLMLVCDRTAIAIGIFPI